MCHPPLGKGALAGPKRPLPPPKLVPDHTSIDFVGARFYAFSIDGLLLAIALFSLLFYGLNFGIDFTGGVLVEVKATQSIDIGMMRSKVDSLGFPRSEGQTSEFQPHSF